jgi:hypothetical protein
MIKNILKKIYNVSKIIIFLCILIYSTNYLNKYPDIDLDIIWDKFREIIDKEISLEPGSKYVFDYRHGYYNESVEYEPRIKFEMKENAKFGLYEYVVKTKINIFRNNKKILEDIIFYNSKYEAEDYMPTRYYPLSKEYLAPAHDRDEYRIELEILDNKITVPEYSARLRVSMDRVGQFKKFQCDRIWFVFWQYVSGFLLFLWLIKPVLMKIIRKIKSK